MSDIYCRMCMEPYMDPRLDMTKWEYDLFMAGAGCPCCEGNVEKPWEPKSEEEIRMAAANGDGCPLARLDLFESNYKPPKWERPEDPILWTCEGCGVNVIRSIDDGELEYDLPHSAKGNKWYSSHPYRRGEPTEEPYHVFKPDRPVCEFCVCRCAECGDLLSHILEFGDTYDDGNCFHSEAHGSSVNDLLCINCFEQLCAGCGELGENCDCCPECNEPSWQCSCSNEEDEEEDDEC